MQSYSCVVAPNLVQPGELFVSKSLEIEMEIPDSWKSSDIEGRPQICLIPATGKADIFHTPERRASRSGNLSPLAHPPAGSFLVAAQMSREPTYRLIVVRPDGTRETIATGIPENRAKALREFLDVQTLLSKLAMEREHAA